MTFQAKEKGWDRQRISRAARGKASVEIERLTPRV